MRPLRPHPVAVCLLALGTVLAAGAAHAQNLPGVDAYAEAVVALTAPRWVGPRVPYPTESDRPHASIHGRSVDSGLAVHGTRGVPGAALEAALAGASRMADSLRVRAFDRPFGDGDLGGGPELDFYLVGDLGAPYRIGSDGPRPYAYLDGIIAHVLVDASMPRERIEACAAEAYADALLAELDPAESPSWRRAVAQYLAWLVDGSFDACTDDVGEAQRAPHTGFTAHDGPHAGALFLAMQSLANDRADAAYVRETWNMARQRTWEGGDLRASPDVWEAIGTTATLLRHSLDALVVDAAVARSYVGVPALERGSPFLALGGLGEDHATPYAFVARWNALPIRTAPHAPPLARTGSAYTRVDVAESRRGDRLRVFLRGEASTRWALVAIAIDASGKASSRVDAPIRERAWDAYLTLELEGASTVIVVVTNLGAARPDADATAADDHAFHLLIDRARDDP